MRHVLKVGESGTFESYYGNAVVVERINENEYNCFDVDMCEGIPVDFVEFDKRIDNE